MLTPGCRSASCELKLTANGESKQVHALYMTRLITEIKPMFATLLRRRRVVPGSTQPVSILTAGASGLTLQVGAAYKLDKGGLAWREVTIEVDCSNDYFVFLADIDEVKRVTSAPIGTLLYYTIVLLKDGKQADKISFDIDNKTRPSLATHFVFSICSAYPRASRSAERYRRARAGERLRLCQQRVYTAQCAAR